MEKKKRFLEYFEEVETEREYSGYFCNIAEAVGIVVLGSLCGLKNVSQIHQRGETFAGLDSPPDDSGQVTNNHKRMTKHGSPALRRTLFLVMSVILQSSPIDEPVYQFMNKK